MKPWAIFIGIGIFFLIGAAGLASEDIGGGIFGLFLASAMFVLSYVLKKKEKEREEKVRLMIEQSSREEKQRNAPKKQERQKEKIVTTSFDIPFLLEEKVVRYFYRGIEINTFGDAEPEILKMQETNNWEMSTNAENDKLLFLHDGHLIGYANRFQKMVSDFQKKGDPVRVWLESFSGDKASVSIAFYKDERARVARRECEVVRLTKYTGFFEQRMINKLPSGAWLEFDDSECCWDEKDLGTVYVTALGERIGALQKRHAERFLSESAAGAFFEKANYDEGKELSVPYVKICW